jgi:hypothetical protein
MKYIYIFFFTALSDLCKLIFSTYRKNMKEKSAKAPEAPQRAQNKQKSA